MLTHIFNGMITKQSAMSAVKQAAISARQKYVTDSIKQSEN